jgi:hypothetical protein
MVMAMSLFPGPLALMLGILLVVERLFSSKVEYSSADIIMTFAWVTIPYFSTINFINDVRED